MAERMRKGKFDLEDLCRPARAGREDRRHRRHHGHAARRRQAQGADGRRQASTTSMIKRQRAIISVDDAAGAAQPRHPQGLAQEAHRRGLRHEGRGRQQAAQAASQHGRHDEGDGRRTKRGPMGKMAQMFGMGGGMPQPTPEQIAAMQKQMRRRRLPPGMPKLPGAPPAGAFGQRRGLPGLGRRRSCRASAAAASIRSERRNESPSPALARRSRTPGEGPSDVRTK